MENLPELTTSLTTNMVPDVIKAAEEWFRLDVANGDARQDTLATYVGHLAQWFSWCKDSRVPPAAASPDDIKRYRADLVNKERKHSTIALKLTIIRRFYQGAVDRKLIAVNPADKIKAPKDREAREKKKHLSGGETELLFRSVVGNTLRSQRDRLLLVMMTIEGLRRVEVVRMNLEDLRDLDDPVEFKILVHGKGRDAYIYPREETAKMLTAYLDIRGDVAPDDLGNPVFVSIDKGNTPRHRLSRRGMNAIVDKYFTSAGVKAEGKSCHALRHTCGYFLYKETRDLRVVQDVLRHLNVATAAWYSDVDTKMSRHTKNISIRF